MFPNSATYDEYLFGTRSLPIPAWNDAKLGKYGSYASAWSKGDPLTNVVNPFADWIRHYQRHVYLPGTVYGLILLIGLGGLVIAWRKLGDEALLPWTLSLSLVVIPAATAEFDYRYVPAGRAVRLPGSDHVVQQGHGGRRLDPVAHRAGPGSGRGRLRVFGPGSPVSSRLRVGGHVRPGRLLSTGALLFAGALRSTRARRSLRPSPATTSVISPRTPTGLADPPPAPAQAASSARGPRRICRGAWSAHGRPRPAGRRHGWRPARRACCPACAGIRRRPESAGRRRVRRNAAAGHRLAVAGTPRS